MYRDELYHYGILGMKWGIRRYQPYRITGPRKSGETGKEVGEAKKLAKAEKKRLKAEAKLKKRAKKEAEKEAKEQKFRESKKELIKNSPGLVAKNSDLFTTQELMDLRNRINLKEDLKRLSKQKTDRVISYLNTTNNVLNSSIGIYNNVAMITNAYNQQHGKLTKDNFLVSVKSDIKPEGIDNRTRSIQNYQKYLSDKNALDNMSADEVTDVFKRVQAMKNIEDWLKK